MSLTRQARFDANDTPGNLFECSIECHVACIWSLFTLLRQCCVSISNSFHCIECYEKLYLLNLTLKFRLSNVVRNIRGCFNTKTHLRSGRSKGFKQVMIKKLKLRSYERITITYLIYRAWEKLYAVLYNGDLYFYKDSKHHHEQGPTYRFLIIEKTKSAGI